MRARWVVVLSLLLISLAAVSTAYISNLRAAGRVKAEYGDLYQLADCVKLYEEAHSVLPRDMKELAKAYDEMWLNKRNLNQAFGNRAIYYYPGPADPTGSSFVIILEGTPFLKNATMVGYYRPLAKNPAKKALHVYARGEEYVREN